MSYTKSAQCMQKLDEFARFLFSSSSVYTRKQITSCDKFEGLFDWFSFVSVSLVVFVVFCFVIFYNFESQSATRKLKNLKTWRCLLHGRFSIQAESKRLMLISTLCCLQMATGLSIMTKTLLGIFLCGMSIRTVSLTQMRYGWFNLFY